MKNLLLFLLFAFSFTVHAQNVNIPDTAFKQRLIKAGFDLNKDGQIQTSEALLVTHIEVDSDYSEDDEDAIDDRIESLEGIAAFKNLTKLNCSGNLLRALDVSKNLKLQRLLCTDNRIASLNISSNISLSELYCDDNKITKLDISKNTNLTLLDCTRNELSSLDVSQNRLLETLNFVRNHLTSIDVSQNPNLMDLACSYNALISLDISNNPKIFYLSCLENKMTKIYLPASMKTTNFKKDETAVWVKK